MTRDFSILSQYGQCLEALDASNFIDAAEKAQALSDSHPRLAAFREIVIIRGALTAIPGRGLLGIDWQTAADASKRIRKLDRPEVATVRDWLDAVDNAAKLVLSSTAPRLQADAFTRRASDTSVRLLLLFMMSALARAAGELADTAHRVHALVNLPEAILQTLAAGFCGVDYANPPACPPTADYDRYFNANGAFAFPSSTAKLALGNLLVVVPAILAERGGAEGYQLTDPAMIRPLQQKLVDAVRNPASHTIANFSPKDARLLEDLSRTWIDEWCRLEGLVSSAELPIVSLAPTAEQLGAMLME